MAPKAGGLYGLERWRREGYDPAGRLLLNITAAEILEVARQCSGTFMRDPEGFLGTGFVVGPISKKLKGVEPSQGELQIKNALCTCKHVIDAIPADALWFNTFSTDDRPPRRIVDMQGSMTPPVQWYRHPGFGVDVAVTRFSTRAGKAAAPPLVPDMVALKASLELGQRVFVIGFPSGIGWGEGRSIMKPIVKQGAIATLDLTPEILIDIQIQPGNSGSLVLAEFPRERNPLKIAGVISSVFKGDPHLARAFPSDCILDCIYGSKLVLDLPEDERSGFEEFRDQHWPNWSGQSP